MADERFYNRPPPEPMFYNEPGAGRTPSGDVLDLLMPPRQPQMPPDMQQLLAMFSAPPGPTRTMPRQGPSPPWFGMDYPPQEYTLAAMRNRSASRAERPVLGDPMYRQQRYGPSDVPAAFSMQPGLFPY